MADTTAPDRRLEQVVAASILGATIEWYDFFLYGVVAGIVFNKLYFPNHEPLVSTLLAYTTFAIGFVARPLGGVLFGHFGDKIGRKSMLVLTLSLMGVATVLIGRRQSGSPIPTVSPKTSFFWASRTIWRGCCPWPTAVCYPVSWNLLDWWHWKRCPVMCRSLPLA